MRGTSKDAVLKKLTGKPNAQLAKPESQPMPTPRMTEEDLEAAARKRPEEREDGYLKELQDQVTDVLNAKPDEKPKVDGGMALVWYDASMLRQ